MPYSINHIYDYRRSPHLSSSFLNLILGPAGPVVDPALRHKSLTIPRTVVAVVHVIYCVLTWTKKERLGPQ
jgi:hypothetical protein